MISLAASFAALFAASTSLAPFHPSVRLLGRFDSTSAGATLSWSGSGFQFAFDGTSCKARLSSTGAIFRVRIDGGFRDDLRLTIPVDDTTVALASGLRDGRHVVEIVKKTEAMVGSATLEGIVVEGSPSSLPAPRKRRIQYLGNSITCGYGILDSVKEHKFQPATEDFTATYAALAADQLGAEAQTVCFSGRGVLRNYDRSTSGTIPALYDRAVAEPDAKPWAHSRWKPDVVVVDLGTNDFATAPLPDSAKWENAWIDFLELIRKRNGDLPIVLANGPMLSDYWPQDADGKPLPSLTRVRAHLRNVARIAKRRGFGSVTVLDLTPNASDRGYGADWHPNRAQAALNSLELADHLRNTLGWNDAASPTDRSPRW